MNKWKALSGRITLFPTAVPSSPAPSALELYRLVWGGEPDNFRKLPNALLPTVAQGRRNGIMASCFSHPARIDFNLSPAFPESEMTEMQLVLIEDSSQLHAELTRMIDVLAKGAISNSVSRVALGVQFVAAKSSSLETNKTLTNVMPPEYRMKITDEEDFIFQVNRPRMSSKVENIRMNFLTKWSMERMQVATMAIPAGGLPIPTSKDLSAHSKVREFIAASVNFDNNNVPGNPLNHKQQSSLLLEGLTAAAAMQRDIGLNIEGF